MKNRIILMAAAIAAMVVSCQKEEVSAPVVKTEPMVITAGVETRTSLGTFNENNEAPILWTANDQIAVFSNIDYVKSSNSEYVATDIDGSSAKFSGSVPEGTEKIYAVYPYSAALVATENSVTVNIPSTQGAAVNTFANNLNVSVARVDKTPGTPAVAGEFENVLALLKFEIPAYVGNAKSVTITADVNIAGDMTVNYSGTNPTYVVSSNASKSISMTAANSFAISSTFWFVVAPSTIKSLNISVTATDGYNYSMNRAFSDGLVLAAGSFKNLGTLEMRKVAVASEHTYTNGVLDGTRLLITLPEADAKQVSSMNLTVKKDGAEVNGWSDISTTEWQKPEAYPYLPQGNYVITGTYTLTNGTVVTLGDSPFTVGAPFSNEKPLSVAHDAYSSYTLYERSKDANRDDADKAAHLALANKVDPLTIYNNTTPLNISNTIYESANYSSIIQRNLECGGNSYVNRNATVNSYGSHSVVSVYKFDDCESRSQNMTCHITGLPYTLTPTDNDSVSPWSTNQDNDVSWGVKLGSWNLSSLKIGSINLGGETYIQKTFSLPADVKVSIACSGETGTYTYLVVTSSFFGIPTGGHYDYYENESRVTVSGTQVLSSAYSGVCTNSLSDIPRGVTKDYESSQQVTFKSSAPVIKVSNIKQSFSGVSALISGACYTGLTSLEVRYSN